MDDSTGKHWYSKELQAVILRERAETRKRLQAEALSRAKAIADFLKREYGVSKVILYGSLTDGFFHERSDIDILREQQSFVSSQAIREARLIPGRKIRQK